MRHAPRLAALLLGVALVVAVELLLRLVGVGDYRTRPDPFAGFSQLTPAFTRATDDQGRAIYRAEGPPAETRRFLADKPADGFRVFVFGGSTEAGTPYGYDYAFAAVLQKLLQGALPDRTVEVVNTAVPGFASRRLLYLAREVAQYQPDLFVISTGHNELVEQRLYAHLTPLPPRLFELQQSLRHLRLYVLLEDAVHLVLRRTRPEVDATKIYVPTFGPMATTYWHDTPQDAERQRYYALEMLRTNVDEMITTARGAGARTLLMSQSKNYADWPVLGGAHDPALGPAQLKAWKKHMGRGVRRLKKGRTAEALAEFEAARAIEAHPETLWRLAETHRARGELAEARTLYHAAYRATADNFGTTAERNAALHDLAERRGTLWLDVDRALEDTSPAGLVGFNYFVDFLHFSLAGDEHVATLVFDTLRTAGVPEPATAWQAPPPVPTPDAILAAEPRLRVLEIKIQVVADLLSARTDDAQRLLDELRVRAPDDPHLPRLEAWAAGDLPFAAP